MKMASGEAFDLCFTGYTNRYESAVYNGSLLRLDSLIPKYAPKLIEEMPSYAWDAAKIDGHIYAVPNLQGFAPPTSVYLFKDLADKYDFDTTKVKKMEDLEPYFETLVDNEPDIIPWRLDYGVSHWTDPVWEIITSGIAIRNDGSSHKVEIIYNTKEYRDAIFTLHRWYKKGILRPDLISAGFEDAELKAGIFAGHGCGWLPGSEATAQEQTNRSVVIVPVTEPYMSKSLSLAAMTAIGVNSKHPKEALQVIELVNTNAELLNLLTLGIENMHYTLDKDGKYTLIRNSGYKTTGAWNFGNQFLAILAQGQDDDVWEETKRMNLESLKSPILGFTLDTDKIKNEIAQVGSVIQDFGIKVAIVNNYADYGKFMAKLEEAGIYTIKDEVQRQIDEYFASESKNE